MGNADSLLAFSASGDKPAFHKSKQIRITSPLLNHFIMPTIKMTATDFKTEVFDYETATEWKFKGGLPAIIDFYADWCGPCKAVAPVLAELSEQYKDQVVIYKINTDEEQELSSLFGIQSIPTFLFIPLEGSPVMQRGALPKNAFVQVINERLLTQQQSGGL
jgi:thioredoxin